jgi:hypothetical protein
LYFHMSAFLNFQAPQFSSILEFVDALFSWTAFHITCLPIVIDSMHIYHNFLSLRELSKNIS